MSLLIPHSNVDANETPKIYFYKNIDLIKDINNEYVKNIKLISKSLVISIKRNQKPLKTKIKRKPRRFVKEKHTIYKTSFVKKQASKNSIIITYNCYRNTSVYLKNEIRRMQHCYDKTTDITSKKASFNLNLNDLGLGLDLNPLSITSKHLDLGLDSFGLRRIRSPNQSFINRAEKLK